MFENLRTSEVAKNVRSSEQGFYKSKQSIIARASEKSNIFEYSEHRNVGFQQYQTKLDFYNILKSLFISVFEVARVQMSKSGLLALAS